MTSNSEALAAPLASDLATVTGSAGPGAQRAVRRGRAPQGRPARGDRQRAAPARRGAHAHAVLVGRSRHTDAWSAVWSRTAASGGPKARSTPSCCVRAHARYAEERDALIPTDWSGPRPQGGVGGTRNGVKCLHAHVAWWLAGGDDPVGRWVSEQVEIPVGDLVVS